MGGTQHVRWKRLGSTAAAAALAAVLVAGVTACPASANSGETIGFGACYVAQQICIPRGTFTINTGSVGGSGNRINYVSGGFTYVGQICNLWIDHDFYAANGVLVGHIQGPEKYGCFSVAAQNWSWGSGWYTAPQYGTHCATLYSQQPGYVKKWVRACNHIG